MPDDFTFTPCTTHQAPPGTRRVEYRSPLDGAEDWALLCPAPARTTWVAVIHGHGSHGDQLFVRDDIRRWWLEPILRRGWGVVCPNLRGNAWMSPAAAGDLHRLLGFVRGRFGPERFLLLSGSMGGTSNLIYACLHGQDVSGVIALGAVADLASYHAWCRRDAGSVQTEIADAIERSYGARPDERPDLYVAHCALAHADRLTMPTYLSHGQADALMPVAQARALAEAMRAAGRFRYREIPGGGHDAPLCLAEEAIEWVAEAG